MLSYQNYEKAVYETLKTKRESDRRFNFSVRQKAAKGAEKDYFIGTEKGKYFGTTFWYISVGFPGSAGDLINVFFWYTSDSNLGYYFEFTQTNNPETEQNKWALELIKKLEPLIENQFGLSKKSKPSQKIHNYRTKSRKPSYHSVKDLMSDVFMDAEIIIPLVNEEISKIKEKNPQFVAHQFTDQEFDQMQEKLKKRLKNITPIKESKSSEEKIALNGKKVFDSHLNQILFGPPGTGKTYQTIDKALKIINDTEVKNLDWNDRSKVKKLFDQKLKEGQIVFTTFHQSMSYEDFIEGIKPIAPKIEGDQVVYKVIPGILKEISDRIKNIEKLTTNTSNTIKNVSNFDELYGAFTNRLKEIISELEENETHSFESRRSRVRLIKIEDDNSILTSGETANSTETITKDKLERIYNKFNSPDEITNIVKQLREVGTDIGWTTNYYAVFKALKEFETSISANKRENNSVNNKQNFVLIIDEINRGNISQIFGELITLIEDDKRLGRDEALEVTLPYSKEKFGVPSNLYIIGTMNTADRSIEALDTALRRRFSFTEMPPKYDLPGLNYEIAGIKGSEILKTINNRIERLLDKDHLIGHSYFLKKDGHEPTVMLSDSFYKNIIPLLQEYFFGDYAKIGAVLGKGFLKVKESENEENIFADFEGFEADDFYDKKVYEIVDYRMDSTIHEIDKNKEAISMNFEKAIKALMNSL